MFVNNVLTIAATNVAEPLVPGSSVGTGAHRVTNVTIQCPRENSAAVAIGGASTTRATNATANAPLLYPGETESFSATDLADVYVAGTLGDRVRFRAKAM